MEPTISENTPSFKTKLIRGSGGGYGWEITVYGCANEQDNDEMHHRAIHCINKAIQYAGSNVEYPEKLKPAKS